MHAHWLLQMAGFITHLHPLFQTCQSLCLISAVKKPHISTPSLSGNDSAAGFGHLSQHRTLSKAWVFHFLNNFFNFISTAFVYGCCFCVHNICPHAAGIQQKYTRTPASRGRTLETALIRISSMDPGSGPFGAALAAAERASITPKHKISRSLSHVCSPIMPITCVHKVTPPIYGRGWGEGGRHEHVMQPIICTFSRHGGCKLSDLCCCCKEVASICICAIWSSNCYLVKWLLKVLVWYAMVRLACKTKRAWLESVSSLLQALWAWDYQQATCYPDELLHACLQWPSEQVRCLASCHNE